MRSNTIRAAGRRPLRAAGLTVVVALAFGLSRASAAEPFGPLSNASTAAAVLATTETTAGVLLAMAAGPNAPADDVREAGERPSRPERRARPWRRSDESGPVKRAGPPVDLTPEQRDRILDFLEVHFPALFDRLMELRTQQAEVFDRRIRRIVPRVMEIMNTVEQDPELGDLMVHEYQLDLQILELAHRYRASTDAGFKQQAREELGKLVRAQFDVQLERQQMQVERLEQRIRQQRGRLEKEAEKRDQIVNRRLSRHLGERHTEERPVDSE